MWRWLEETVRAYADESREVHVTSGAVFLGALHRLPNSNVGIPRQFFKIVVRKDTNGRLQPLAFLLTNGQQLPIPPGTQGIPGKQASAAAADAYLVGRLQSVLAIKHLTGMDFFPNLSSEVKSELEEFKPSELWSANTAPHHRREACTPPGN